MCFFLYFKPTSNIYITNKTKMLDVLLPSFALFPRPKIIILFSTSTDQQSLTPLDFVFSLARCSPHYPRSKIPSPTSADFLTTLDLFYNSPGIGDNKLLCKASLYLNLIKPNNSLPLTVLDPSISNLLHLNQTNQLINQTTSRSHLLLTQEKLSKSVYIYIFFTKISLVFLPQINQKLKILELVRH